MNVNQTGDSSSQGDASIGDETITPIFDGQAPQEQLSSQEGEDTQASTQAASETSTQTTEAVTEATTEPATQ